MNREIKFRAYDSLEKKMYYPKDIFEGQGIWYEDDREGCLNVNLVTDSYGSRRKFEMMQYTGLKDKNGREIYEGDVIKLPDSNPPEYSNTLSVVEYSGTCWCYKDIK